MTQGIYISDEFSNSSKSAGDEPWDNTLVAIQELACSTDLLKKRMTEIARGDVHQIHSRMVKACVEMTNLKCNVTMLEYAGSKTVHQQHITERVKHQESDAEAAQRDFSVSFQEFIDMSNGRAIEYMEELEALLSVLYEHADRLAICTFENGVLDIFQQMRANTVLR